MFALPFLDDDEEEEFMKGKKERMLNSMLDGSLRGIGIYGAIVSTIKNMAAIVPIIAKAIADLLNFFSI